MTQGAYEWTCYGNTDLPGKKYVKVKGHKLAYMCQGSGEPILFIHGIITYSFIWRNILSEMSENNYCIAVDILGCGDSDKPMWADYSVSTQADLMVELLDELHIEKCHLVGHDIGGAIVQIMAVRNSERIITMTLINTVGYDYWPVQPITSLRIPILKEIGVAVLNHGFLRFLVKRGLYHKDRLTDEVMGLFLAPLQNNDGKHGILRLAQFLDNQNLLDIVDGLKNLKVPTLIIRGAADVYLPSIISKRLHEDINGSKLIVIHTGGHLIQEDEPEFLVKEISRFIKDSKTGTSKLMS